MIERGRAPARDGKEACRRSDPHEPDAGGIQAGTGGEQRRHEAWNEVIMVGVMIAVIRVAVMPMSMSVMTLMKFGMNELDKRRTGAEPKRGGD